MKYIFLLCGLFFLNAKSAGQFVINELCADNQTNFIEQNGDSPDWIEFLNIGQAPINLEGYTLSDEQDDPNKWTFPDFIINPNEYLLVLADGKDLHDEYLRTNFKLSKSGERLILHNAQGQLISNIRYDSITPDLSFGIFNNTWQSMSPSPGFENTGGVNEQVNNSIWSHPAGFYDHEFYLKLTQPDHLQIYFSNDGQHPKEEQIPWTDSLLIDKTQTICISINSPESGWSQMSCRTYFINTGHDLPVVSVIGDPHDFFDEEDGIFEEGPNAQSSWPYWGANFWKDIKLPCHIEYFENGQLHISQNADLEMHGGRESRTAPMKSIRITADAKHGDEYFDFPFFEQKKNISRFKKLVLRNASGDYNHTHLRDGFLSDYYLSQDLNLDVSAYKPIVVYINGAYYGLMGLREKIDEDFIFQNDGISPSSITLLEEDAQVIEGDSTGFLNMYSFMTTNDLADNGKYEEAKTKLDIENFIDYFIVQIGMNNTAWPNGNIKFWNHHDLETPWRYLLFDMDIAMGRHAWTYAEVDVYANKFASLRDTNLHLNIFTSLLEQEQFKHLFLNRNQDIFNTVFVPERIQSHLDLLTTKITDEIVDHFEKWSPESIDLWEERLDEIHNYLSNRPALLESHMLNYFDLTTLYNLNLTVSDSLAGFVSLNSLDSLVDFEGRYFVDIPITLQAHPHADHSFSYWLLKDDNGESINNATSITINRQKDQDFSITAVFDENDVSENIIAFVDLLEGKIKPADVRLDSGSSVKIYNLFGQLLASKEASSIGTFSSFDIYSWPEGIYVISGFRNGKVLSQKLLVTHD